MIGFRVPLIKCSACRHDISEQAESCPNCGHPLSIEERATLKKASQGIWRLVFIYGAFLAFLVLVVAFKAPGTSNGGSQSISIPATTPGGVPIEWREATAFGISVEKQSDVMPVLRTVDALVGLIRENDYRCDSISDYDAWVWSKGFTLECDHFNYKYEISDHGRGWELKAD
jgi:hypothetical protein